MIIVSDMMGTLTLGSPVLGQLGWMKENQSKLQANLRYAAMIPSYFLAKGKLIDLQTWGQGLMVKSLGWIENATPEKLSEVAEWAVEHDLWAKRRKDVIARLEAHAAEGGRVYVATSVVEPIAQAFASRFGAQAIATPVKIINGRAGLASGLVADQRKADEVLNRLNVQKVDFAYGDTALDIPLLEKAKHPVAVYPDEKLRKVATQRGWEIIGETPSYE